MISVTNMETSKKAKPSEADIAASKRLKAIYDRKAKSLGINQDAIGEAMGGKSQGLVSQYINGYIPLGYHPLMVFSKMLEVDPAEIRNDLPEQRLSNPPMDAEEWSDVKGFAQAAGLGHGREADEYAEIHKLKFKASSLRGKRLNPEKLTVFYGAGDSMLPRIRPGDAILFDESDTKVLEDTIYVVMWRGEYYAKRAQVLDDRIYFKSDNPSGDSKWVKPKRMDDPKDPITVIGRVRWIGSWED